MFATSNLEGNCFNKEQLNLEKLNEAIKKCKPGYAVIINEFIPEGKVFEIENYSPEKYFCHKLLVMNRIHYETTVKEIANKNGVRLKVYEK